MLDPYVCYASAMTPVPSDVLNFELQTAMLLSDDSTIRIQASWSPSLQEYGITLYYAICLSPEPLMGNDPPTRNACEEIQVRIVQYGSL